MRLVRIMNEHGQSIHGASRLTHCKKSRSVTYHVIRGRVFKLG